ncbi:hypothetical protein GPALN_014812 [Globodera pallida]|nr:hypothetical protein GPALN_014812 [Globodera pallida]
MHQQIVHSSYFPFFCLCRTTDSRRAHLRLCADEPIMCMFLTDVTTPSRPPDDDFLEKRFRGILSGGQHNHLHQHRQQQQQQHTYHLSVPQQKADEWSAN